MPYVPPKYPGQIPTAEDLPDRNDDVDWLLAARYNELKKELRAALIELGVDPSGAFDTVRARLDAAAIGDKISEGDSSVEVIDTDADGHVEIKTEGVLCGKFHDDGILDLPKQSGCVVTLSADQDIPKTTWTTVEFNVEDSDPQNEYSTATYKFTTTRPGIYLVSFITLYRENFADGGVCIFAIAKNDARIVYNKLVLGGATNSAGMCGVSLVLAANDTVSAQVFHYHGEARKLQEGYCRFSVAKVG